MTPDANPAFDRAAAERLLRGDPTGPAELCWVLGAAAGPAQPGELAGEQDALRAFNQAQFNLPERPRRRRMIKLALTQMVMAKAFTATAAAAAVGTVAVGVASGFVPIPGQAVPASADGSISASVDPSETADPSETSDPSQTAEPSETAEPTESAHPKPSSEPTHVPTQWTLRGLCIAVFHGEGDEHGKRLANPAFLRLINAAGGIDNVPSFCATLVGPPKPRPSESDDSHSEGPDNQGTHPSGDSNGGGSGGSHEGGSHSPEPTNNPGGEHSPSPSAKPSTEPSGDGGHDGTTESAHA